MDVDAVNQSQSVDWLAYFKSIRKECPWSYAAYVKGLIDIQPWTGQITPLLDYEARVYVIDIDTAALERFAEIMDSQDPVNEWLFSYPGYGEYAAPVKILIQQDRTRLNQLRDSQEQP